MGILKAPEFQIEGAIGVGWNQVIIDSSLKIPHGSCHEIHICADAEYVTAIYVGIFYMTSDSRH
eukprot:10900125-Ditylum_brightwellii.AAC.1